MGIRMPACLLVDESLTVSAKMLWLSQTARVAPPLDSRTVARALDLLRATMWYDHNAGCVDPTLPVEQRVAIPTALILDPSVRDQAKLLYGLLQIAPGFAEAGGQFTYKDLARLGGTSTVTVKECIRELSRADWIYLNQANQKAPIRFILHNPELQEVSLARRRLGRLEHKEEAVMKEYLSLLIDSDAFEDNARPGFLVHPQTQERLEFDRYYPPAVAFEYHGQQHFRTTKRFPDEAVLHQQQTRDLVKAGICARRGITLVVVTRDDLSLKGMQAKVGHLLPLRDLRGHEPLSDYLATVLK